MRARSLLVTVWGDTIRAYGVSSPMAGDPPSGTSWLAPQAAGRQNVPAGGEIGVSALIRLMAPLRLSPRAVRAAVSRMARQGWLRARREGRRAFYALTPAGTLRVEQGIRRVYRSAPEPWDGRWRLLTYAIPEGRRADRDRLRRELTWLGLGPLSRSTWVSARDLTSVLEALIAARGLDGAVTLFEARHLGPHGDPALVRRCWDLDGIAARYRAFLASGRPRAASLRRRLRAGTLSDAQAFAEKIRLVHEYRKFLFVDPGLPDELLPRHWPGRDAARLFRETYRLLAGPAARFAGRVVERTRGSRGSDPEAAPAAVRSGRGGRR